MANLVSIIVPVYNVEKYLTKCLDSILSQDYQNLEILLINDGSTDTSPSICEAYCKRDSRFKLINKENGGQSSARNVALNLMNGDWVMFVDSDDEIAPDMVSVMLNCALSESCEIVRCSCLTNGSKGRSIRKLPVTQGIYERGKVNELLMKDILGSQPCFGLYKSFLWNNVRFPEGRIYEDLAILFQVYFASYSQVALLDKPLYIYNLHDDSTSFKITPNKNYDRFLAFKERHDFASQKNLPYEDYCFHLAATTAIGTYNYYLRYKEAQLSHLKLQEVFNFLETNRQSILHDKYNSAYYRIMFRLFYINTSLYKFIIRALNRIKNEYTIIKF